tara:strand:+ start:1801 stop:2688 length:888 start_codon:yes stop_codon:yes gene_type:complete
MRDELHRPVDRQDIVDGLRSLGVEPGMGLMVHSSLKSFGHVEGGAKTVIAALQEAVTETGTVMMPSFNHGTVFKSSDRPDAPDVFDPKTSPTSNGAIPMAFWQLPGVYRSLSPTHSFACWGNRAEAYTRHHHRALTIGPTSPLGRLCHDGGYGLLLGVGYHANTVHHLAEYINGAPCHGYRTLQLAIKLPEGRTVMGRTWGYRARQCPITDQTRYASAMTEQSLESVGMIASSRVTLFRLQDCVDLISTFLQNGLAPHPPCRDCPIRPAKDSRYVASDWDKASGTLLPESDAWSF